MMDHCDCERCLYCRQRKHERPRLGYWAGLTGPFILAMLISEVLRDYWVFGEFMYGVLIGSLMCAMITAIITDPHARWNR